MPVNERSRADQPANRARPQRRRLLAHLTVFAIAGLLVSAFGPSPSSAAPAVQDGRFLPIGDITLDYTCGGADQATINLLTAIGLTSFTQEVNILSPAVEPAPSPGEDFEMSFIWNWIIPEELAFTAVDLGQTTLTMSESSEPMNATTGATGSVVGSIDTPQVVNLGDGTQPVPYTTGPYTGTVNRTAAVDSPIVFTPGTVTSSVVTSTGITLLLTCSPEEGVVLELLDETGEAPILTTTTTPPLTTPPTTATPTTSGVGGAGGELPRTGTSSNLLLVLVALGLMDIGYLAWSAGRRRASSAH